MQFLYERLRRLTNDLAELQHPLSVPLAGYRYLQTEERFKDVRNLDTSDWKELGQGELWGGHREYFWFTVDVTIPEEFDGKTVVYDLITGREDGWDALNPQFSVYLDGKLKQGLDTNHRSVLIAERARAGETHKIVLSAFTGDNNFRLEMNSKLSVLDRATEKYYYDIKVPLDVANLLSRNSSEYHHIITALNDSLNLLDLRRPGSPEYYASLADAQANLNEGFYQKYCDPKKNPVIYAVGHTHIDVAWLWTLAVTEDKTVRSFSSMMELLREYPDFIFMSSQVQLYKYVEKHAPELFEEIREQVAAGRWEAEGAMFVEADCNVASGEALVRQVVYGKRYFKEKFGKDNEILWLPDVFGYSAALPQILQKARVPYFMTTKISWNETNKLPYDTFEWQGIDGSKVLTHFIPTREYNRVDAAGSFATSHFTTYNGFLNAEQTLGAWQRYTQKDLNDFALMSYGHGDGGGGTTREMIENGRRLSKGIPGAPRIEFSTALDFFHRLDEAVMDNRHLPTWSGELYLEYHRGTYTSMGRNKRSNRKSEYLLQNLEFYASLAGLLAGAEYPAEVLAEGWEILMRNQFHDILPGSSIKEVYDDSKVEYEHLEETVGGKTREIQQLIASAAGGQDGSIVVFNPTGFVQNGQVRLPEGVKASGVKAAGSEEVLPVQSLADGTAVFWANNIPAFGFAVFRVEEGQKQGNGVKSGAVNPEGFVLENDWYRITFNRKGQFAEVYDKKNGRQVLKPGQAGNVIMSYEDRPHNFENWDINNYYVEKSWEVSELTAFELTESGPVRQTVRIERPYLESTIVQEVHLYNDSARIDVENDIDWKNERIMMKALFPLNLYTHEATFEIQYGHVKRQTHHNTTWDQARFEVPVHKWLDVSEYGYGVSILNDCKYGCHVRDSVVGVTLLKSGTYPNPDADKERHFFTYSLMAHAGTWQEAGTLAEAYALNNPLEAVVKSGDGAKTEESFSFVSTDSPGVTVEVVKKAEDSNELVVRLYESYGQTHDATLKLGVNAGRVSEVNLLEEELGDVELSDGSFSVSLTPFEIKTFKLTV